jgi:predicted 3-demethylubiquinone-9 3-methyltransferase (glyoxalase superfamily)
MNSTDPAAAQRVMQAMLKMKKIIIADLEEAHKG